jgi:hypothetical protein
MSEGLREEIQAIRETFNSLLAEKDATITALIEEVNRSKEQLKIALDQVEYFKKEKRDATLKALNLEKENKELKGYMERHNIHE